MSAKKKNGGRNGWSPQDEYEYEMSGGDSSADETKESIQGLQDSASANDGHSQCEASEAVRVQEESFKVREEELALREHALEEREKLAEERESEIENKREELKRSEASIIERETAVRKAESDRDEGYRASKAKHEQELQDSDERSKSEIEQRRQDALRALQEELASIRATHDATLKEYAESERASIASERAAWKEEYDRQSAALAKSRSELDQQRGALDAQKSELDRKTEDFNLEQLGFERQRARYEKHMEEKKDEIDALAEDRVRERKREFEAREQESREEIESLLEQLMAQERLQASYEELKRQLGGRSGQDVLAELVDLRNENARLNEEIAAGVKAKELSDRLARVENERDTAYAKIRKLEEGDDDDRRRLQDYNRMQSELALAESERDQAKTLRENTETYCLSLEQQLSRYVAVYEKHEEFDKRKEEIKKPYFTSEKGARLPVPIKEGTELDAKTIRAIRGMASDEKLVEPAFIGEQFSERMWLETVTQCCEDYGLHFNPRLMKAFHTSLKTAEWSPLTVLAGVSGTGKSELPRLYSHFGGLYFMPVAVQPNWDSKESMLGFFNSIDNRFDAEPVLRFLAQSQEDWLDPNDDPKGKGYPGLSTAMCLTLLDEMNLAHPELYFAEFLSKFESRRGEEGDSKSLPAIDVKLGTAMELYQIPLGRNMLWAGTMNQDETTKSLSDKVLDRSIMMHFPRPTELKRRQVVKPLNRQVRPFGMLHVETWNGWKIRETNFTDEEILPYKQFVEKINDNLGEVGRAVGHRVWQSIEYYIASYPDVRAANPGKRDRYIHDAFEDQIVQKIMPKLRGIDTEGESYKRCLKPIGDLLRDGVEGVPFKLDDDYKLACKLGYGQFVWQSANYLKEDPADDTEE